MKEAAARALAECGKGCSVVLTLHHGCGAYAADQEEGSSIFGWAQSDDSDGAQFRALEECQAHGGRQCIIRVWGCNSR